jgi:hypothetical protein
MSDLAERIAQLIDESASPVTIDEIARRRAAMAASEIPTNSHRRMTGSEQRGSSVAGRMRFALVAAPIVAVLVITTSLASLGGGRSPSARISGPGSTVVPAPTWRLAASLSGPRYQLSTNNPGDVQAVNCSEEPTCFLSTAYGPGYGKGGEEGDGGPTSVSHDGGLTWQATTLPTNVNIETQVSCVSTEWCAAGAGLLDTATGDPAAEKPSKDPEFIYTTNAGGSWTMRSVPIPVDVQQVPAYQSLPAETTYWPGEVDAVSCSAPGICNVLGQTMTDASAGGIGDEFVFLHTSDDGTTWQSSILPEQSSELAYQASPWSGSLGCPTADDCVAMGSLYPVFGTDSQGVDTWRTENDGRTWIEYRAPDYSVGHASDVSCPDVDHCWAGPATGTKRGTQVLFHSADGGARWSPVPLPGHWTDWASASCVSNRVCFVAGVGIEQSTNGGAAWERVPLPTQVGGVLQISCNAEETCVALANPLSTSAISNFGSLILTDAPESSSGQ